MSIGRPFMPPYEEKGPEGVSETVKEFTNELRAMMLRTGSKDLKSIDPSVVKEAYWL